jgi:hypothetical protein
MSRKGIIDTLVELGKDCEKLQRYIKDQDGYLAEKDLTSAEKKAIKLGHKNPILKLLGKGAKVKRFAGLFDGNGSIIVSRRK